MIRQPRANCSIDQFSLQIVQSLLGLARYLFPIVSTDVSQQSFGFSGRIPEFKGMGVPPCNIRGALVDSLAQRRSAFSSARSFGGEICRFVGLDLSHFLPS